MQSADREAGALDGALELHQATGVERNDGAGFGFANGIDFGARHSAGDLWKFDREGAAEAAALLGGFHFPQRQPADFCEQPARAFFDLQLAQGVTAIVISDHAVETRAHIFYIGHLQKKPGKLPNACA